MIEIRVSTPAWSESKKSWHLLTESNKEETSWSTGIWFPKKICNLKESEKESVGILEMPKWFYEKTFKK